MEYALQELPIRFTPDVDEDEIVDIVGLDRRMHQIFVLSDTKLPAQAVRAIEEADWEIIPVTYYMSVFRADGQREDVYISIDDDVVVVDDDGAYQMGAMMPSKEVLRRYFGDKLDE